MKVFVPAFKYIVAFISKAITTGKSEDIYGLSIENIIYAGEEFLHHLLDLINNIIAQNSIPELVNRQRAVPNYESVRASL
jgi:hypothetical protein